MKILYTTFLVSLLIACGGSEENQAHEITQDTSTDTIQIDSVIEYDFTNCPKAWNLEEALAAPDSFCSLALLGHEKKYKSIPVELASMPYLRKLDVHGNQIKEIPSFLSELTELDMSSNQLKTCPKGLENVPNLIRLSLSYNQITILDPALFNLKNLEELSINQNALTELPKELFELTNLRHFSFSGNPLIEFPSRIFQLTKLEELYLNSMDIDDETLSEEMKNLTSLKTLSIGPIYVNSSQGDGSKLTHIPSWILELDSLENLDLSYGYIEVVSKEISQLKNLTSLNLEGNYLKALPESIKKLSNLSSLYLGANDFSAEEEIKIRSWFNEDVEVIFEPQNIGD